MGDYDGPRYVTVDPDGSFSTNPFENSVEFANDVQAFVEGQVSYLKTAILGSANVSSIEEVGSAIDALANFELELPNDLTLLNPNLDATITAEFDLPEVNVSDFGQISPYTPGAAPTLGSTPNVDAVTIPTFNPSIGAIYIPDPPTPSTFADPGDVPSSPTLIFPDAPSITLPEEPALATINIPPAPDITIPTFDETAFPTLEELDIDTLLPWQEPTYTPEIWTDVKAQLQRFFAGGTGLRPEVEDAIVNRGVEREDRLVQQSIQEAEEEWSRRGFSAPPGMLVQRIDRLRDEGLLKKLGLQREVVIKAMEEELQNLRFACQQGIVAEQLFIGIFLASVERLFLVQRLNVEWQIQIYNILVQAYQAKLQEHAIRAQVFEVRVRAALAEIEVFKALIDAERAKAEINRALVEAYTAQIQARESLVNIYEAQVRAVGVRASVFETEVNAYRAKVEAFGERVNADKLRFDAYEAQVRGESAKAGIIEAEARAYQAEVEGIGIGVRAQVARLEGAISEFRAEVEAYEAQLAARAELSRTELAQIQANVAGYQADTQRFVAAAGAEEAKSRVELAAWETRNRVEVAAFEAQISKFRALLEKAVQQANMALEGIKSAGDLASTISAGALAAMHVGATMNGSGSVNATGSDTVSFGYSQSKGCSTTRNVSLNYEADVEPDFSCEF